MLLSTYTNCLEGHLEVVKLLIEMEGVLVNQVNNEGFSALMLAAYFGNLEVVKLLIEKEQVLVNQVNNKGDCALILAVSKGHEKVVKLLLKKEGTEVNRPAIDGWTPISYITSSRKERWQNCEHAPGDRRDKSCWMGWMASKCKCSIKQV